MESSGLSASDVLSLTRGNDGFGFGGVGGFILLFIFLIAISGNGFGFGGNSTGLALADIQASLYNQTQDANARSLAQGQCGITDAILNASYNNLLASKDTQYQISNSIAGISNQISNQTLAMQDMFNQAQIRELSDKLATTRDELSNTRQTATLVEAINGQTATILNSLGKWRSYPPCYDNCGCNNLY
jgi:hypothetical protein